MRYLKIWTRWLRIWWIREAAALRSTGGVDAAISGLGIDVSRQKPSDAPLDKFDAIPPDVRAVLIRNGIDTVGKLSDAGPKKSRLLSVRSASWCFCWRCGLNARAKIIAKAALAQIQSCKKERYDY